MRMAGNEDAEAAQREENAGREGERANRDVNDRQRDVNAGGLHGVARGEHGPVSDAAQDELEAEGDFEVARGDAQVFHLAEARGNGEGRPKHHKGDDSGADEVRDDAEGVMAEGRAQNDLDENEEGRPDGQGAQFRRFVVAQPRNVAGPPFSGEDGNGKNGDEEKFGERGVRRRNRRRQKEFHGDAAENGLRDDQTERAPGEVAEPAAGFTLLGPDGENDGEDADEAGDHAMAVLVKNSADHGRKERAVRKRPVRNGEAGFVAGDQRARDDEKKRAARGENGEAVKIAIPCFSQNQAVLRL